MSENTGSKRARNLNVEPGRDQLLITAPELQTRFGRKFVDESELLPLLLSHGLVHRVRTIEVHVRPLGGDSFAITLDVSTPTVGEAKTAIARSQGTAEDRQELYKVAERADGLAVREDDAEPELLDDESMVLKDGEIVAMAVKESPLLWRTFPADRVTLSEGGAVATHTVADECSLVTTGIELTVGKHYWEVGLLSKSLSMVIDIHTGISRPNLDPEGYHRSRDSSLSTTPPTGWFINTYNGCLFGNGKFYSDGAGSYKQGDRVGMLLDLDNGSLRFFKNGVEHGPGYPAGSVTGPVVEAVQLYNKDESARLLPNAEGPAGV
jgi:hypothetical protein